MQVFLKPPDGASREGVTLGGFFSPQPVSLENLNTWPRENRPIFCQFCCYKAGGLGNS